MKNPEYFKTPSRSNLRLWAESNKNMFNEWAEHYDFANGFLGLGMLKNIRKKSIDHVPIRKTAKILDVCTGSGDAAIYLAQKYPDALVIGIDAAEKMLDIARHKAKQLVSDSRPIKISLNNLTFQNADALSLPFADNFFDTAVICFGLRNLADCQAGLKEMIRVVKPGGYVMNLDLGKPQSVIQKILYKSYVEGCIPLLGKLFYKGRKSNILKFLPESNKDFPSPTKISEIFQSFGIKDISCYSYLFGSISQQIAKIEK